MKKKIIRLLLAAAVMTGCYSNLLAAEAGTVNTNTKAYKAPDELAEIALYVYEGEEVEVIQELESYYEIIVEDEKVYIEKVNLTVQVAEVVSKEEKQEVVAEHKEEVKTEVVEAKVPVGEKIVAYAKQFIGTPYVSGGNNLKTGVDCSGFTQQVYKNFGINLQRRARDQFSSNGYKVSKTELKAGDLVFYGYSSVTHVAIYAGNNQIIHSPVPGKSVSIAPLWQRGDAPIMGYRRILRD